MAHLGVQSILFVIVPDHSVAGMVLAPAGFLHLRGAGSEGLLSRIALSLIRGLGLSLTALMVTRRAGSALTAEIGLHAVLGGSTPWRRLGSTRYQAPRRRSGSSRDRVLDPLLARFFDVVG